MKTRIITGVIAFLIVAPILIFSSTLVFPIAIAVITVISLYELYKCMGVHKKLFLVIPAYILGAAAPFAIRYEEILGGYSRSCMLLFVAMVAFLAWSFVCIIWSHGKLPFTDGVSVFMMSIYIISALCALVFVRDVDGIGAYLFILIFIGSFATDIFAYFTGVFLGKHKLIEDVSPKKTIEGSIGGIFFCTLFFVIFGIIIDRFFGKDANLLFVAISGIIISVISQIGDLIMSVIKRNYGIKDYGRIFPGHGGMLDRLDSILIVSLVMAVICVVARLINVQLF